MISILRHNIAETRKIARQENTYDIYLFWVVFAVLAFFMFFYFVEMNNLATIGYKITKNEKALGALKAENISLVERAAKVNSPQAINALAKNLNLVGGTKTAYVKPDTDLTFFNKNANY